MTDLNSNPSGGASARGSEITPEHPVVALGGGPAGLTAGYLLAKQGKPVIVLESTDQVGGIARTDVREGYRFDLGGHRFFTKAKEVDALWHEILADEFLRRPRQSRIYWNHKFLEYPLQGMDVIKKLGPVDLTKALFSYMWAAIKPKGREDTFEQWVTNRFGRWLFNQFFKSYTEKVWGVSTSEIRGEWAAQRIKGLSFFAAAKNAFFGNQGQPDQVADLGVQLPALWTGADVGEDARRDSRPRRRGPSERAGDADPLRRQPRGRGRRGRGDADALARDLLAAAAHDGWDRRARCARRRPRRGARASLPRLPHGAARDRERGRVPRQLDLHPRPVGEGRANPEFPLLEPVHGSQRQGRVDRDGVLLLRGGFALEHERRQPRGDGDARDSAARPRPGRQGEDGLRRARTQGLSDVRRPSTPTGSRRSAGGSIGSRT